MDFAAAPHRAADHVLISLPAQAEPLAIARPTLMGYAQVFVRSLRSGGVREVARRARGFIERRRRGAE
jgi:hypothetical protein